MAVKARSYAAANTVLTILGGAAWLLMVVGVIAFFSGFSSRGFQGGLPVFAGLFLVVLGVFSLAFVQVARASVHSAEINWEILQILRQTSIPQGRGERSATLSDESKIIDGKNSVLAQSAGDVIKSYKGQNIIRQQPGVSVGDRKFASLLEAERWIDGG